MSLVEREGETLRVVDQHLTNALLKTELVSSRVWISLPTTHLLSIDSRRFVFGGGDPAGIQIFDTAGDKITRLSRSWHSDRPFSSMATTPDLLLVGEYGTYRGPIGPDGSLPPLERIQPANGHRLRFIEDEDRVFGIGAFKELHSFSPSATDPQSRIELEGVKGLDFDVHADWFLAQRAARDGDMGDIALYRRGDATPTHSWKQTIHQTPIGAAFVQDSLLIEWLIRTKDDSKRSMRWELLALPGLELRSELSIPLRGGGEGWYNNPSRMVVRGSHILAEPFGQWLHVTDEGELEEYTGPGQGTLGHVLPVDDSHAAVVSFDSTHHVSLAPEGLQFESGGRLLSQSSIQAGGHRATSARLPLIAPVDGFEALQQPLEISAALDVAFLDLDSGEPRTLDELTFEGEALLVRGRDLLVLSSVVQDAINVERYRSFPSDDGRLSVLDQLSVPVNFPSRHGQDFRALDYDSVSGDIVLVGCVDEKARGSWLESSSGVTVTFQFDGCPDSVVLMGNKTLVFLHDNDGSQVVEMRLNEPRDAVEIVREVALPFSTRKALARTRNVDTSFLVLEAIGSNGSGLAVLEVATLTPQSFHTLPLEPSSVALVGSSLIASTTKSLHQFEPACGAAGTIDEEPWPYPDAGEAPPSHTPDCPALPSCLNWEAPMVPGDANRDGCVDGADLIMVQSCFGLEVDPCTESVLADLDGNGTVDDYTTVVVNYGNGCN